MNGFEKPFRKKPIQKIEKTVKIKVKLPHVNKKPLPIKRIFVQTTYSHSSLKLERKNFTPQNHSLFRSNLTSKTMKMCEQIFKTAPQYNSNSLNCKKTKRRPIIAPAIAVRLLMKDLKNGISNRK